MAEKCDYFKLVLVGCYDVGKSQICVRFTEDKFNPTFLHTFGCDFKTKTVDIDGKKIKLHIWDTGGNERYRGSLRMYYTGTAGMMLVYNIADEHSFNDIRYWMKDIEENAPADVEKMLLGSKCDLSNTRVISKERGQLLADEYGIKFMEVCAMTNTNVEEAFLTLVRDIIGKMEKPDITRDDRTSQRLVRKLQKENESLQQRVEQDDTTSQRLVRKLQKENESLQQRVERDDTTSQRLVRKLHKENESLRQRVERQDRRLQELTTEKQQNQQQIQKLRQQNQQIQELMQQIKQYRSQTQTPTWVINRREIKLSENELGRGAYGCVKEGTFRDCKVAVKCLHHQLISDYNLHIFDREMTMAARCHHPNLLQFIGATNEGVPLIVTEIMHTSLRNKLERGEISGEHIINISIGVACGLNYLHKFTPSPILHRDVSSSNVLLNPLPSNQWLAKLSDFGSFNFLKESYTVNAGNPVYAAPEALDPIVSKGSHSPAMDVYSFGVLLHEMCSRRQPTGGLTSAIVKEAKWKMPESSLVPLISSSVEKSMKKRPNMDNVITQLNLLQ